MADPDAITAMIERVSRSVGPMDLLVNDAGSQHVAQVKNFPPRKWNIFLAVNLSVPFHAIRVILPDMKRHGFRRIVNIASAFKSAYVAAKRGLGRVCKGLTFRRCEPIWVG